MLLKQRDDLFPFFGLGDFIDSAFSRPTNHPAMPRVNIIERENEFELQLAIPGMCKDNVTVDVQNNTLTIKGEQQIENECRDDKNEQYLRQEFGFYSFSKSFSLPESVDANSIKGNYNDGVLTVSIPKKRIDPDEGKRTIEIG